MKVTIVPVEIGAFGTITKGFLKGLEDLEVGRLGTINLSHVINSGDLLNKIKDINMQNKTMNSLDITFPYKIIPIKKKNSNFLLLN